MNRSNIAAAINAAHERVEAARKTGLEAAVDCGKLLTEAKATVKHGGWGEWVAANCRFSARTAQLYMNVAAYLADGDPAKAQRVADLSLREVARVIAKKPPAQAKPLSPEASAEVSDLMAAWHDASPAARVRFAHQAYERGDISLEKRNKIYADAYDNPFLTEADRDNAAKRMAADMMAHITSPEDRQKLAGLVIQQKAGGERLARAFRDALERETEGQRA